MNSLKNDLRFKRSIFIFLSLLKHLSSQLLLFHRVEQIAFDYHIITWKSSECIIYDAK